MSNFKVYIFFIIYVSFANAIKKYDDRPRIYVNKGHLKIEAPPGKNINFIAQESSIISINDINVLKTLMKADNATRLTNSYQQTLSSYTDRLEALEARGLVPVTLNSSNSSADTLGLSLRIQYLLVRVNRLNRKILHISSVLSFDDCQSNPCKNGGTCQDSYGNYICHCSPGWQGPDCSIDVNECSRIQGTDLGCQNGGICRNTIGSYVCDCINGFIGLHCARKSVDCIYGGTELCGHGTCVNQGTVKGYTCLCHPGWTSDSKDLACTKDVNECQLNHKPCATGVPCINVPGSFVCGSCPLGFTGNGYQCNDLNECDTNNGGCSINPMVLCINTHGSRVCGPCPAGYSGDGTSCSYLGVCNINNGGCHPMATCSDNSKIGTQCTCPLGYTGNGIGPNGCVHSSIPMGLCSPNPCLNGACSINASSKTYQCHCFRHYAGRNCDTLTADACTPNPCMNDGECQNVNNRLRCKCKPGYTGTFCQIQWQGCRGVLRGNNGTLKYPSGDFATYNHRSNCAWAIYLNDTSKVIHVNITKFDIEPSPGCRKDWLEIHDGQSTAAHTIGRFCGNTLPLNGTFTSTHDTLYLWFRSDGGNSGAGFELTWTAEKPVCGGLLLYTTHGSINSPGSPGNYPLNRDCNWRLSTTLDKRFMFHFFSLQIGENSDCNADYVKFYSTIYGMGESNIFAKFCNSSTPAPFYSPGSRVNILFHSDNKDTYPGFQLTYSEVEGVPGCGGTFSKPEGIIQSAHPELAYLSVCEYKIQQNTDSKIKINFLKFNFDGPGGCTTNYIEIHEGNDEDSPTVGRYCGKTLPPPYISQGNQLTIISSLSGGLSNKGWKLEYKNVCGLKYSNSSGSFNTSIVGLRAVDCIYLIERPPGNVILLTMKMNFQSRIYLRKRRSLIANQYNCLSGFIEVRDGDYENSTLLGKFCGSQTVTLTSTHNFLWIRVNYKRWGTPSSNVPVTFDYTSENVGCGGILRAKVGNIAPPAHPDGYYPSNLNCKWTIIAPPQEVIRLTWMTFNIEESNECMYDNIQVFDNNTDLGSGALIGKYCGFALPPTSLSSSNIMTIVFKTDGTVNTDGFLASYATLQEKNVCGGNYFTPSGVIKSPRYPDPYPTNRECTWTINVQPGQQIMLNVTYFNIEDYPGCRYDWLEIRNGGTSASPLIAKFCGTKIPKIISSHANKLYLFFKSDLTKNGNGFRITWSSTATGCGGVLTSPTGSLISPHYPEPYSRNTECLWKIITSAGSRVQAVFSDIDLEKHIKCLSDYVQIFDGLTINSNSLGRFCNDERVPIKSTRNEMLVKFRSDVAFQGRGFQLHYVTVCQNTIKGFRGIIESPNFPNDYPEDQDCLWEIEVADKNKINITFSHFELERSATFANKSCEFDFVEISYAEPINEYDDTRTYKKYGKYCGQQNPGHISLDSDHVQIRFVSDKLLLGSGFQLEWEIFGCGGILKRKTGTITSPNYPNPYPSSAVCEWRIEVDFSQSIQLEFHEIDIEKDTACDFDSVSVYNGMDDTYNLLSKICRQKQKTIISSTGNFMFVRFRADPSYQGKGFMANYSTIPTGCGGKISAVEGYIYSPNYPKNYNKNETCNWSIDVDEGHSVEFLFEDLDLYVKTNSCLHNYVKIYDGPSAAYPVLKTACGNITPNETFKSTFNNVFVEFRSHSFFTTKGFKLKYYKACGSRITTQSNGIISINQDDFSDSLQACEWIIVSSDPSKHVSLTISHLSAEYFCQEDDDAPIKVYNGQSSDSPLIGQYCGPKVPPTIVSDGAAIRIIINSQKTFSATYTVIDSQCGGTLTSSEGYFASPGYPKKYADGLECEWTIQVSPGNHLSLSFIEFNLKQSKNCDTDYLEIRSNNASGKILGVFCGNNKPENITHVGSLWLLFKGSKPDKGDTIIAKGFYAEYMLNTNNELNGTTGEIWSPMYPLPVMDYAAYTWKITVRPKKRILLSFKEFYLDANDSIDDDCYFVLFEVFDGVDDTANSLGKHCGLIPPPPIKSTSNIMFIKVDFNSPRLGSKFKVVWEEVEGTNPRTPSPMLTNTNCGNITEGQIYLNTTHNYTLTSPGYPGGYEPNLKCQWIFSTIPMNHLIIYFTDVNLAVLRNRYTVYRNCELNNDNVKIYQKHFYDNDWQKVKSLCMMSDTHDFIHTTDLMKIEFTTTRYINGTGFKARILEGCGGWLREPRGYIIFTNSTIRQNECQWNITVGSTKTIELTFEEMNIDFDSSKGCDNFLMIRNGKFADSPLLGSGKYCGSTLPDKLRSTGNNLYIIYKGTPNIKGFRLKYQEVSANCGGRLILSRFDNYTEISSPNYPNIPNPHIECQWFISAPSGESLRVDFEERFDLTYKRSCNVEYVELRDGGTEYSQLIGRYCQSAPSSQFSTDNMLFIKFFTDTDEPKNGFKAKISIARCGGTVRGKVGEISFVSQGSSKSNNCTWHVVGPKGHYLMINFSMLDVPNCSNNYVLLKQNLEVAAITSNRTLGRYCGNSIPKSIISDSNEVIINFVTGSLGKFSLTFNSSEIKCGEDVKGDSGVIKTPEKQVRSIYRSCKWVIEVPEGRRVTLHINEIDMASNLLPFQQYIAIYDGDDIKNLNRAIYLIDKPTVNNTFESSSNKMTIFFWSPPNSQNRGLKAYFTSYLPSICEGDFTKTTGIIKTPSSRNSEYHCEWTHRPSDFNQERTLAVAVTIATNVSKLSTYLTPSCSYSPIYVEVGTANKENILGKICENTSIPVIFRSPFLITKLQVLSSKSSYMNFTASYTTYQCGGVMHGQSGIISSPNYPNKPTKAYECAWLLIADEGQNINVTFFNLNLGDDCDKSYIVIYNGELPTRPKIGKYCKQSKPETIISQSNNLWIEYKHDPTSTALGFQLHFEAISSGCGGFFHDRNRNIHTPNFGSGDYPNSAECLWIIESEPGYHIKLNFVGRFHLEQSSNCSNDFVEIWHWDNDNWVSLGKKCGRETPTAFESKSEKMKILFRSNGRVTGRGFKASWEWLCGGKFIADKTPRYIVSPGYPYLYPKNLKCEYTISGKKSTSDAINLKFLDFSLELGNPECKYDNVTISSRSFPGSFEHFKKSYCGNNAPPLLRMRGIVTIIFQTDPWVNRRGFKLEFKDDSCGGTITKDSVIEKEASSNLDGSSLRFYQPAINCLWNITAPPNQIAIITITKLKMYFSPMCMSDSLEIYNALEQSRSKRLVSLCGNLEETYQIPSDTGKMLVRLNSIPSRFEGFRAIIQFSHGPLEGCGGLITLTESKSIRSPNLENLDCGWKIVAPKDYQIEITINKLSILTSCGQVNTTNTDCDCMFLEVRDGASPFSEKIETFCKSIDTSIVRSTSANNAYIRLLIRGQKNDALQITLRPVISVCGPSILKASKENKELLSPNFGQSYPPLVKCSYTISGITSYDKIFIHFEVFDLTGSVGTKNDGNQCQGDYVRIFEDPNRNAVNGLGSDVVYKGGTKNGGSLLYSDPKGKHIFCGQNDKPFDYYSSGNVTLSFVSNDVTPKGKGFKIIYAIAGCNRNYTEEQGRINIGSNNAAECSFWIIAPVNRTINVYFTSFYMFYTANCSDSYFEIRDGSLNGNILTKICGYRIPDPVFSTSNKLYFKAINKRFLMRYDIIFTSTEAGRGCGGNIFNNKGKIYSPLYPNTFRNDTVCTWKIRAPISLHLVLKFTDFDIQGKCEQTNVKIETTTDLVINSVELCSSYRPGIIYRSDSFINIIYTSSIHNGGSGWIAHFQAVSKEVTNIV